jgi:hypothetical protein
MNNFFNPRYTPSDCDVHETLLTQCALIPVVLSIRNVRALLNEYGSPSRKYIDDWRDVAISLQMRWARYDTSVTIADVSKRIKLLKE